MSRFWSSTLGMGDLDYQPDVVTFTPDSGAPPLTIKWVESRTGQANQRNPPRGKAAEQEWEAWLTFTTARGEMFSFRRRGPK